MTVLTGLYWQGKNKFVCVCCFPKVCADKQWWGAGERKSDEKRILTDGEQNRLSTDCPPTHPHLSISFLGSCFFLSAWRRIEWLTYYCPFDTYIQTYARWGETLFVQDRLSVCVSSTFVFLESISLWRTLWRYDCSHDAASAIAIATAAAADDDEILQIVPGKENPYPWESISIERGKKLLCLAHSLSSPSSSWSSS